MAFWSYYFFFLGFFALVLFLGFLTVAAAGGVCGWLTPSLLTGFGARATGVRTGKALSPLPALRLAKHSLQ